MAARPSDSRYALINVPVAEITDHAGREGRRIDEALYGFVCRILEDGPSAAGASEADGTAGRVRILTHYGLTGFIDASSFRTLTSAEVMEYLKQRLKVTDAASLDVLDAPCPDAEVLITLTRGSLLHAVEEDTIILPEGRFALEDVLAGNVPGGANYQGEAGSTAPAAGSKSAALAPEGWTKVILNDGREGYVPSNKLAQKYFTETYLFTPEEDLPGGKTAGSGASFSFQAHLNHHFVGMELIFRQYLLEEAMKYTGVQFRAGGRSGQGIDSAGLVMTAYMRCGVTILRDAASINSAPLQEIVFEKDENGHFALSNLEDPEFVRAGDVLCFKKGNSRIPFSCALYLGGGHFIHASDLPEQFGVVMNSLYPDAPDYREDLHSGLYAVCGLRPS